MADPPPIRDVFETEAIKGVGGHLEFNWPSETSWPRMERLEVKEWEIHEIIPAAELPISGGFGAITRRRVCSDFEFTCAIDLDLKPVRDREPAPGPMSQPFPGSRMEGAASDLFVIKLRFHCGDPTFWDSPELTHIARTIGELPGTPMGDGVNYRCDSVIVTEVWTVGNAHGQEGKGVVSAIVKGKGSAPLRRYVGADWCGTGWLGIARTIQHPEEVPDA